MIPGGNAAGSTAKKHDVGFSFLSLDEPLARNLADQLTPLSTFVYSAKQEELVATNALESFRKTFRYETRVPVVLFRRGWGSTPITRIESMAIQEYCAFEADGWDRLVFVTLDDSNEFPPWLHKQHIRFDLRTFTLDQLVGAIKNTVLRAGGAVRVPTPAELAAAMAAREQFDEETRQLLRIGGRTFLEAAKELFGELDREIEEIQASAGWTIVHGHEGGQYVAFLDRVSIQLLAKALYVTSSHDAHFILRHFDGRLQTPIELKQPRLVLAGQPTEVTRDRVELAREPGLGWVWRFRGTLYRASELAGVLLTDFLERRKRAMMQ